jgi:hypothetical protein
MPRRPLNLDRLCLRGTDLHARHGATTVCVDADRVDGGDLDYPSAASLRQTVGQTVQQR